MDLVEMEAVITVVFKTLVSQILNHSEIVMSDLGTSVNIVYLTYLKPFLVLFSLLLPWKKKSENCIFCIFETSSEIYNCSNRRSILLDIFYQSEIFRN